jgi:iron complex outermembrane recepter protein
LNRPRRIGIEILFLTASAVALAQQPAPPHVVEKTVALNLAPQPLEEALHEFSRVTGLKVMLYTVLSRGIISPRVSGNLTPGAALDQLLKGAALRFEYLDPQTIAVLPIHDPPPDSTGLPMSRPDSDRIRTAAGNDRPLTSARGADNETRTDHSNELLEIVVSAQKRDERIQDVPVPVTAIRAQTLESSGQTQLQDYYSKIPALSVTTDYVSFAPVLSIRGLSTGSATNPTVGIVIDDVPYGASTNVSNGTGGAPDVDPSDLARVEVLRGPQGTLYGASTLGGLLKYVTVDPTTDGVSGYAQASTSSIRGGDELGYAFRGAVNVPLGDIIAIRASGFTRMDPGYIDNVVSGLHDVNKVIGDGGHLTALWRPDSELSLKLSALIQHFSADGSSLVRPDLGDLKQGTVAGTGWLDKRIQAYSATITAKLGDVHMTSLSGYNVNTFSDSIDLSPVFVPYTQFGVPGTGFDGFGVAGISVPGNSKTKKFSQEIRLTGAIGAHFDWLVGGFYTHENSRYRALILATDPVTGEVEGGFATGTGDSIPTTYMEYAGFADLTAHIGDRFDIQFGARESQNRQTYSESIEGLYGPLFVGLPSPVIQPEIVTKGSAFTYLVTPRFKFTPELMIYARLASGYRAGGPNLTASLYDLPPSFKPDKTNNYEVGFKGEFLDHTFSVDTSVYYIDWNDIQLQLNNRVHQINYFSNASRAKSQGLELFVEGRPLARLTVSAWIALNLAELTQGFPPTSAAYGVRGDRLPYANRFSGNLSADWEFPFAGKLNGVVGASVSYVGARQGPFTPSPERQTFPSYTQTDVRAGAKYDLWSANLFVNNVADKRGLLAGGLGSLTPLDFTYTRPRTVGLSVSRDF